MPAQTTLRLASLSLMSRSLRRLSSSSTTRLSRRRFLAAGALGLGALAVDARWVEPGRITVTRHILGAARAARAPLRLVQLSDLHLQRIGKHETRVAQQVHELAPDVVVVTGDAIDRADRLDVLDDFLGLLPLSPRTFAILGNWEHWAELDLDRLAVLYAQHGIQLLVNESVTVEYPHGTLLLTGLDDATAGYPQISRALAGVRPTANHLILAHSPVYRDQMALAARPRHVAGRVVEPGTDLDRFAPEYMLSGHTHGGQVQLLGWAPLRPRGSGHYVEGWYRDARPHLYVSRGIGTSVLPIRFGASPEISMFEWHLRS